MERVSLGMPLKTPYITRSRVLDQQDRAMKSLEFEGKVVEMHTPKIETSVP